MIQPLIRLPLRLLLPIAGLPLGAQPLAAEHIESWNQSGSAYIRLESPDQVTDPSVASEDLRELFVLPIEEDLNGDATDFWVVRNARTAAFAEDQEDEESIRGLRFFARYETWNQETRRAAENGMLVWRLQDDPEISISSGGNIGFIRSGHRPSELPAEPVVGHFTGAEGSLSWAVKSNGTRAALIELTGAAYRPEHRFEDFVALNISAGGAVTVPGFDFPVPDLSPVDFWRFDTSMPQPVADGVYLDIVSRFDGRTQEEVHPEGAPPPASEPGVVPHVGDPGDFWSRIYFLLLIDDQDSDRDGIPDFADLTESFVEFPWYADFDGGDHWYYSAWLDSWIFSDRRLSELWDYNLRLGWTYVPLSSSRDNFWMYAIGRVVSTQVEGEAPQPADDQLGWIYTNRSYFPNFYRAATGETLQLLEPDVGQPAGSATFYNFTRQRFETVQF